MKGDGKYKLLLQSIDPQNAASIQEAVQKLLGVGRGQAVDIIDSVPIILLDGITSKKKADHIKKKFKEAIELGAEIIVSSEPLEHTPTLRWPEEPEIARDGDEDKEKAKDEEVLTLAKYNFVVDRRNVFRCPHCNKMFLIKELTAEEEQDAQAQEQIAERLQMREPLVGTGSQVSQQDEAVVKHSESSGAMEQPAASSSPEQGVEEMEPIQDAQPKAGIVADADADIMDLATFEEGLSSIEYEAPEAPELALPPDAEPVSSEGQAQDFFRELESLPVEGGNLEESVQQPSDEAVQKESELEELQPEEAMKYFEGRREKAEEEPEEEKRKIVAPRRGAGKRRMQRLREKQDMKGEKRGRDRDDEKGGRRRPSGRRRRVREEPEEAPVQEVEHTEGFHGVVLSRIGSREKKKKAAKYIVELTGMHPEEARDMCEGTFVNVIRGISEEEANEIAVKFKDLGVSAKVTLQKRKMRQSERMQRRK
jgi:ribosomal protein L7/L12